MNIYMATSKVLREHSHGKGIDAIVETAAEVIGYVKKHGLEVRFSCEDSFRSDLSDILKVYSEVSKLGVDRVGVADTVGVATPGQVFFFVFRSTFLLLLLTHLLSLLLSFLIYYSVAFYYYYRSAL